MDGATITARISKGLGIAAKKVGSPYDVYRPKGVNDPLAAGNKIVSGQSATFAPYGNWYQFGTPSKHGDTLYTGLFDPTGIQVGDYFVSAQDTYFILSLDHIEPPLVAQAFKTMTFVRPVNASNVPGRGPRYGGNDVSSETPYMANWPISLNLERKLGQAMAALPGDAPPAAMEFFVPYAGVEIKTADIGIDGDGNRWVIGAVEKSPLGWRIYSRQAVA